MIAYNGIYPEKNEFANTDKALTACGRNRMCGYVIYQFTRDQKNGDKYYILFNPLSFIKRRGSPDVIFESFNLTMENNGALTLDCVPISPDVKKERA